MANRLFYTVLLAIIIPLVSHASGQDPDAGLSVSLDRDIQFIDPDRAPVRAHPGNYQVEAKQDGRLLLRHEDSSETLAIRTQPMTHSEKMVNPLAVIIPREDGTWLLAYLRPDGTGLVAVGTVGSVRERGLLSSSLTSDEVKLYLALKLEQTAKTAPKPTAGMKGHEEAVRTLLEILRSQPGGPEMIAKAKHAGAAVSPSHPAKMTSKDKRRVHVSVVLTPNQPPQTGSSLAINPNQPGATITVKVPRNGWYLVNISAKVQSPSVRGSLSVTRILKTVVSGKAGRSEPNVIRSWEETTQPGEEYFYPALVELKAGEHEFSWIFTSGSAEVLEARILSL